MSKAQPTVYLAGPITGLRFEDADEWRIYARNILNDRGIMAFSPLRGKEYLAALGYLPAVLQGDAPLSTSKGIVARDRNDCTRSDVVLVNLIGATRISVGTMVELGWADAARNPIIICMEPGNIHEHAFLDQIAGYRVHTLDEGIDLSAAILLPDGSWNMG